MSLSRAYVYIERLHVSRLRVEDWRMFQALFFVLRVGWSWEVGEQLACESKMEGCVVWGIARREYMGSTRGIQSCRPYYITTSQSRTVPSLGLAGFQ